MSVIDLPRVREALLELDRLAGIGVRPLSVADLEAVEREVEPMKATSVRLTAGQEAELERLAEALQQIRPELSALARGGELSPYTVLRLAIDRGVRELARDVELRAAQRDVNDRARAGDPVAPDAPGVRVDPVAPPRPVVAPTTLDELRAYRPRTSWAESVGTPGPLVAGPVVVHESEAGVVWWVGDRAFLVTLGWGHLRVGELVEDASGGRPRLVRRTALSVDERDVLAGLEERIVAPTRGDP